MGRFVMLLLLPSLLLGRIDDDYDSLVLEGYTIYVECQALAEDPDLTNQAIGLLASSLAQINDFGLDALILSALQAVPIFMDWKTTDQGACFHPSKKWLLRHGYPIEKWQALEISNVANFVDWCHLNQPYMILHELAHAYHFRVLGMDYEPIEKAYESAMAGARYDTVRYHAGNRRYIQRLAYASNNKLEYFAEITEAFLGRNDFYPFEKGDLWRHDPKGYQLLEDIWVFDRAVANLQKTYFRNSRPIRFIHLADGSFSLQLVNSNRPREVRVYSCSGRLLKELPVARTVREMDLSDLPAGVYFISLGRGRRCQRMVKFD